jgi:hypothetical protein
MATPLTFEEALQLTHPDQDFDKVKTTYLSPKDIADNIWTEMKDTIITEVRNTLSQGEFKYFFDVTEYDSDVVSHLKTIFKEEFTPSGAIITFVPQHCEECQSYLVFDYTSLNRKLALQKKTEAIDRMNRNTFIVLGTGALAFACMMAYMCFKIFIFNP